MSGEEIYGRKWRIQVGSLLVDQLKVEFQVTRTLKPEPNKCELHIYNLSEKSRLQLESLKDRDIGAINLKTAARNKSSFNFVDIQVGYESTGLSSIYLGEVRSAHSVTRNADIVTEMSSGDGETDMSKGRINVPIEPGMPPQAVLASIIKTFGIGEGNAAQVAAQLAANLPASFKFPLGGVLQGSVADELDMFCRAARLDWSIQNGQLLLLPKGKGLAGKAILLSSQTGLYESPTVDSKGIVSAKIAMLPDVFPGRVVTFAAKHVKGFYRVEECQYNGDTDGAAWDIDIKCKKLKLATDVV